MATTQEEEQLDKTTQDRLRMKELELDTQYKMSSLSDSFENLKQFFDNFKTYVDSTLHKMEDRLDRMRATLESFMEKQEQRNEKVWKRLNIITFLVILQLFDVKIDLVDLAHTVLLRIL